MSLSLERTMAWLVCQQVQYWFVCPQVQDIVDGTANVTVGTVLEGLLTIACNGSECEQLDGAGNLDKTVDILEKVSAIEDAEVTQNDAEVGGPIVS